MTTDTEASATTSTRARAKPAATNIAVAPATAAPSKSDSVIKLLLRTRGATPLELIVATDWQPHSIRAFLSGLRKKGRPIVREARKNGEFAYRIVAAAPSPTSPAAERASMGAESTDA